MRLSALVLLALSLSLSPALRAATSSTPTESARPSWPNREVPDFNVMNNDDGDWLCVSSDPEVSRRAMERAIDEVSGTAIKTHVQCVALGSDVMYYPTKVANIVGWGPLRKPQEHVAKAKACIDAGLDPIRVVGERARKNGMKFVPSYRLNDAHFAREPEGHYATSKFWVDNHEKMALPNNRLDFSHPEVREFRLATINEVIDRYGDISDGFELDFTRHGMFFPAAEAKSKAPLLTEMVAATRARLDELEKKTGRPCFLIARVWATLDDCTKSGIDVESWMKRRLIDVVIPAQLYSTSFDMPIDQFVKIAKPAGVKVYPCLYERSVYNWPLVRKPTANDYLGEPSYRPKIPMYVGAAATYRALGADGFEMYNFRVPLGTLGNDVQRLLSTPAALNGQDRAYVITPAEGSAAKLPTFQDRPTIPAKLPPGKPVDLSFTVGDNLASKDTTSPAAIVLRLGFRGESIGADTKLRVTLNGTDLHEGAAGAAMIATDPNAAGLSTFGTAPAALFQMAVPDTASIKQGVNALRIELLGGLAKDLSVTEVQLGVFYDDRFNTRI